MIELLFLGTNNKSVVADYLPGKWQRDGFYSPFGLGRHALTQCVSEQELCLQKPGRIGSSSIA